MKKILESDKMKICIISNLYNPYIIGGAEINAERLAKALSKENEILVITASPFNNLLSLVPEREIKEGIKIYRFYPLNLYSGYFTKRRKIFPIVKVIWHIIDLCNFHTFLVALYILKKEKPDIIHTNNLDGLSFSIFWTAKLLKIPLVHTLHDYHLLCPYANLLCPYTKFSICKNRLFPCKIFSFLKKKIVDSIPKVIIGPSKFIIDIHEKYGFFRRCIKKTIPYFVRFRVKQKESNKKDKNILNILYAGRLSKEKGVNILVEAFKELKEDFLRLHVVGDGNQKDSLEKLGRTNERIIFYGRVLPDEIEKFYHIADFLVCSSIWYENFPTVVLEAFSFGVPVIGAKIGGIPEQIIDGYNGFLFEYGDKEDLKEKIKIFIEDFKKGKRLLKTFSMNAYTSSKKYSEKSVIPDIVNIYQSLLEKKGINKK